MKFSVIIPVFNVEKYIYKCLESVVNQSLKDFECIIVDDGSSDNSGTICDEISKIDKRFQVIHQKNKGVSAARNAALQCAKGEYICFVDSDDWVSGDMLSVLNNIIERDAPDIIVFGYSEVYHDREEHHFIDGCLSLLKLKEKFISDQYSNYLWNKCFRKELFNKMLFAVNKKYEDLFLVPSIVVKAQNIVSIRDVLYYYNQCNESSITKKADSKSQYDYFEALLSNFRLSEEYSVKCNKLCEYSLVERAQMVLLANYKDNLLEQKQIDILMTYCQDQRINKLIACAEKYKFWRRSAIIHFHNNEILLCVICWYKYILYKFFIKQS